ncbi:MAG: glycosyltransferase family 4 protein [Spongiibacteraceae bacterium]
MCKHILHITYDMNIGGTEQVIRNLVEGLNPDKFQSSILCIDGQIGPWGKELEQKGFKHYCLSRQPGFDLGLIKAIRALIKEHDFDIIHCHQYTPYTYGWFGALFTGKPVIFTEHGRFYPDFSSTKRKLINPVLQLGTAAITAISAATKDALVKFENFSASKIQVIYNGIADSALEPPTGLKTELDIHPDDIVLGTISRLDPIKNQTMMIKAFKQALASNDKLKLLIVGDGPSKAELHQLCAELALSEQVIFTGFQPNPQAYLAIMDIFLLPSLSEGTSMTLLEAMCFIKPSIATAVGGTPEILAHEQTGLLTDNDNEAQLSQAINTLADDKALRDNYGAQARAAYQQRFTLHAMSAAYEALYLSVSKPVSH